MRNIPSLGARVAMAVAEFNSHISPSPPPVSHPERCIAQKCPWLPSFNDFKPSAALIIVVLFCPVICALAFHAGIRYIVRLHRRGRRQKEEKEEGPGLSYEDGMKLAGEETECTICLADFVVGEKIRVLDKCKHGFHLYCIQRWLISHSSCPTCRTNCST